MITIGYRRQVAALLALVTSLALVPVAQAQAAAPRAGQFTSLCGAMDSTHPATVSHVMFILFENKSYGSIVGSKSAPYINQALISGCGLATNYHNYSHPSTSNYLALTSGAVQGKAVSADCLPSGCPQPQASIFSQLSEAGQTWGEYAEAMPSNCDKKDSTTRPLSMLMAAQGRTTTSGTPAGVLHVDPGAWGLLQLGRAARHDDLGKLPERAVPQH